MQGIDGSPTGCRSEEENIQTENHGRETFKNWGKGEN
jgi:hypothetical protein